MEDNMNKKMMIEIELSEINTDRFAGKYWIDDESEAGRIIDLLENDGSPLLYVSSIKKIRV
jgi:hypothetical protein